MQKWDHSNNTIMKTLHIYNEIAFQCKTGEDKRRSKTANGSLLFFPCILYADNNVVSKQTKLLICLNTFYLYLCDLNPLVLLPR